MTAARRTASSGCTGSLGWPGVLDLNDFDQVYKSTEIAFIIFTACHMVNADRDGSVWFLLDCQMWPRR